MPVQLRIHATRPLNDCVSSNWIVEGSDQDVCAGGLGGADRVIQVTDQIARTLGPEWIRNRRLESEHRQASCGRQNQLRHGAAWSWRYSEDSLLCRCASECGNKAPDKTIKV